MNKTWKNKEEAKEAFHALKKMLSVSLAPYYAADGRLNLGVKDPTAENGDLLARLLNCMLAKEDEGFFAADTIVARQVIIDNKKRMRFWGKIYWLSVPKDYTSFKQGYDPFYAEFILDKNNIEIETLKFGDHNHTNIDKVWWYNMDLDWKFEFDA